VVAAAPVAGPSVAKELSRAVDDLVILVKPAFFRAVAQVYRNWYDVGDDEVIRFMQQRERYASQ